MKKVVKKKGITIDDLAMMTQRGFDGIEKCFDAVETRVGRGFAETKEEFTKVHERLDVFEHLLIGRHDKRLDKLEDDMRVIKTLLEKKTGRSIPKS
jgi:tetrahydromethanopterin S-methyltransferase subunit G